MNAASLIKTINGKIVIVSEHENVTVEQIPSWISLPSSGERGVQ